MSDYFSVISKMQSDLEEQRNELTEIERFIIWAKEEFKRIKQEREHESRLPS